MAEKPNGMLAILTAPDGYVISTATDFEQSVPAGYNLRDAQEARCRKMLAFAMIRDMCHPDISKVMEAHHAQNVVSSLVSRLGYHATYIPIGHDEASNA